MSRNAAGENRPRVVVVGAILMVGIVGVSTGAVLVRLADAAPLSVAAYRLAFASLILLPSTIERRHEIGRLGRRDLAIAGASGAALAAHFGLWIASLDLTSVASSVALVTMHPLLVAAAARVRLGEKVSPGVAAGVAAAIGGALLITLGDAGRARGAVGGDLLALGGAAAFAAYVVAGRDLRARCSLRAYVGLVYSVAAGLLLIGAIVLGAPLVGFPPATWRYLLLMALVPQIIGHSSFNWALQHLSATFVSGTVLAEILGSTLLAWWFLGEAPPATALVGGAAIVTGLVLAGAAEATRRSPAPVVWNDLVAGAGAPDPRTNAEQPDP